MVSDWGDGLIQKPKSKTKRSNHRQIDSHIIIITVVNPCLVKNAFRSIGLGSPSPSMHDYDHWSFRLFGLICSWGIGTNHHHQIEEVLWILDSSCFYCQCSFVLGLHWKFFQAKLENVTGYHSTDKEAHTPPTSLTSLTTTTMFKNKTNQHHLEKLPGDRIVGKLNV